MKWIWWICGAILFIFVKNLLPDDGLATYLILFGILLISTLLGQRAERKQKECEQRRRDAEANQEGNAINSEIARRNEN